MKQTYFVTGIDTDIGKSYVTGFVAKMMAAQGQNVVTQKLIQTGNQGVSEDIQLHRRIMGLGLLPEDLDGTTCPVVLSYPASPHLAAEIDHSPIDLEKVVQATARLHQHYEVVLIEGAGGIMVPLTEDVLTIDFIAQHQLPVIIATTPRLGSINHTLLTLEACRVRGIAVHMLAYNEFRVDDEVINKGTRAYLQQYLVRFFSGAQWMDVPHIEA
ncbi:ATP-dependent dethiobiotin synthetase BioD 1 [Saezia sanguinis]|uniref:ATP-dependent dethiobiotin synthetase BioD n=1 Tax=Saezia sanguinis TaxID=1965230 RepID=A0A433SBK6_9BURK|nr:dethiobiotin synthase [Saezia sanguinis]RUS66117.1 ATP-dependent dethiobiotin synthetase BioD 1 [Saezia sanguinis]